MVPPTRREFVQSCVAALALGISGASSFASDKTPRAYDQAILQIHSRILVTFESKNWSCSGLDLTL
jgi:hypothetical protein